MLDVYEKLPVCHNLNDGKIRSRDVIVDNQLKFSTLLLQPMIHDGLSKCGYVYLSPIQQSALPLALAGSSVIAHAKSGTGKTLIYVLTVLNEFVQRKSKHFLCLVLAPTREIAKQIYDVFRNVACFIEGLQIEFFIGGTPLDIDVLKCMNCHIAIGAPGRIKHLIDLGYLKTENLQLLVLDEVDALLDHKEFEILDIISLLPPLKQVIVCTATCSPSVNGVLKSIIPDIKYTSMEKLEMEEIRGTSNMLIGIKQYIAAVENSTDAMRKREKLVEILQNFNFEQCFIFVNYISLVKSICNHLLSRNFSALWISSEQNQSSRINILNKLKLNHCKILVTTDLAARGIDVHNVNLVINLGLPSPPDVYIHRMGRAGRYGSEGAVITILSEGEEMNTFTKLISMIATDPVNLHVLPGEIGSDLSNLETISCLPSQDLVSVDEFSFKRSMKDKYKRNYENGSNQNNKNKKKKTKTRKKINTFSCTNQLSLEDKPVNSNNHDEVVDREKVRSKLEDFKESLLSNLFADEPELESTSLDYLFRFRDGDAGADEKNVCLAKPPECLLSYATYVKQKNKLMDQQTIPCSVDEFLSTLNYDDDKSGHYSFSFWNLIKDVSLKNSPNTLQGHKISSAASFTDFSSTDSMGSENCPDILVYDRGPRSQRLIQKTEKAQQHSIDRVSKNSSLSDQFLNIMMNTSNKACLKNATEEMSSKFSHIDLSDRTLKTENIVSDKNSSNVTTKSTISPGEVARTVDFSDKFLEEGNDISPKIISNAATKTEIISSTEISGNSNSNLSSQLLEKADYVFGKKTSSFPADKARKICSNRVSSTFSLSDQFLNSFGNYSTNKAAQKTTNPEFLSSREQYFSSCNELNSGTQNVKHPRNTYTGKRSSFDDAHNNSSLSDQVLCSTSFVDEKSVQKTSNKKNLAKQRRMVFRNSQPTPLPICTNNGDWKSIINVTNRNNSDRTTRQFPCNFVEIDYKSSKNRLKKKYRRKSSKQAHTKLNQTNEPTDDVKSIKEASERNPNGPSFSKQSSKTVGIDKKVRNSSTVLENAPFSVQVSCARDNNELKFRENFQNPHLSNEFFTVTDTKCSERTISEMKSNEKKPMKRKSSEMSGYCKEVAISNDFFDSCNKNSPKFSDCQDSLATKHHFDKNTAKETEAELYTVNDSRSDITNISNEKNTKIFSNASEEQEAAAIKSSTLLNFVDNIRKETANSKQNGGKSSEELWETFGVKQLPKRTNENHLERLFDENSLESSINVRKNRSVTLSNDVNSPHLSDLLKNLTLCEHNTDPANKNCFELEADAISTAELSSMTFDGDSTNESSAAAGDQRTPKLTERVKKPAVAKFFSDSKNDSCCSKRETSKRSVPEVLPNIIDERRLDKMAGKMKSQTPIKPVDIPPVRANKNFSKLIAQEIAVDNFSSSAVSQSPRADQFLDVPPEKSHECAHSNEEYSSTHSRNIALSKRWFNVLNERQSEKTTDANRSSKLTETVNKFFSSVEGNVSARNVTEKSVFSIIPAARANEKTVSESSFLRNRNSASCSHDEVTNSQRGQAKCSTSSNDSCTKATKNAATSSKMSKPEKNYSNANDRIGGSSDADPAGKSRNARDNTISSAAVGAENRSNGEQIEDEMAVTLPSLQSFVNSYRENEIWQNHFNFINQCVSSRFRSNPNRRH